MKKIHYNLARERKIDGRRFAVTLGVLLLALAAVNAVTVFNLARLQRQDRAERTDSRSAVRLLETLKEKTRSQQEQIALRKKAWERPLAAANFADRTQAFLVRRPPGLPGKDLRLRYARPPAEHRQCPGRPGADDRQRPGPEPAAAAVQEIAAL